MATGLDELNFSEAQEKFVYDLVIKAYEHHKAHARFAETQRYWMLTIYLALTGFVFHKVFSYYPINGGGNLTDQSVNFLITVLLTHLLVGILFMVSVSKVSGEFSRHFTRAEEIVEDVKKRFEKNIIVTSLLQTVKLETAAKKKGGGKYRHIALLSNAAVYAYFFSLITTIDVVLLITLLKKSLLLEPLPILGGIIWFLGVSIEQHLYIIHIEKTGMNDT